MSQDVSEVLVDALSQAGAKRCYGIAGDTINHLTDTIRASDLDWVHVRHEEVGAFAAGAEAFMTGELALCAGTCGPGSVHFVNGILESHRNGAPVVLIASDIARAELGVDFPQHVDQKKLYEQFSVFCERIEDPDQTRRLATLAAQAALTKGGVAVLVVNGDMFPQPVKDDPAWSVHRRRPVIRPADDDLDELASLIGSARAITLFAGIGARDAADQVVALARHLHAPVACTTRAKEFIEPDNPNFVGMTGILGNRAGFDAVNDADLVLCLGSDFAYTQYYPARAHVVQIDTDPAHIGRRAPVRLGLVGDVGDTIEALIPRLAERRDRAFLDDCLSQWEKDQKGYRKAATESDPDLIHPQYLCQILDGCASDDAIFTADGGGPMVWMLRHITANGRRRFLTSLKHGTMANAYPQALGIQCAWPDRQVIAMCGDGGMTMLMGDLLTLVQRKLPVKLVVFNNGSLGFVEMEQRVEGLLDAYTELENPDFAELARVCGMAGHRAETADDLEAAVKRWLHEDGPALLDVPVSRMEMVMPPKVEMGQVVSTALYGVKGVLGGRSKDVMSLLRDNFIR